MTPELREILEKYARSAIGEVTDATLTAASNAHPLLGKLASVLLGEVLTEETTARMVTLLGSMLREVFGDDLPLKVEADEITIEDKRK